MGKYRQNIFASLATTALAICSGCTTDFYAKRLLCHTGIKGTLDQKLHGSVEKMIARDEISSHHRVTAPDGIELDVWVLQGKHDPDECETPRNGTVVLIHGLWDSKTRFFDMGQKLRRMGYTVVMHDQRAHGRSGGKYVTFGAKEKHDIKAIVDALLDEGVIQEPIYAFGQSMGSSTAVQYAALDPRCQGVMAVSPYTDMRTVARRFVPLMKDDKFERVVARAGEIGGFTPDDASTIKAAEQLSIPLLVVHGKLDNICPHSHGQAIYDAAQCPKELIDFDLHGHVSLVLARRIWFAEQMDRLIQTAQAQQ